MRCQHAPLLLALVLSGCALPLPVRALTYAPSFQYIEPARLREAMWRMAEDVNALDAVMRPQVDADIPQAEVVRLLDDIREAASKITAPGQTTNHPMLDRNLQSFLIDIALAREAAARTPPSYFLTGSVTGSCLNCHARRSPRH